MQSILKHTLSWSQKAVPCFILPTWKRQVSDSQGQSGLCVGGNNLWDQTSCDLIRTKMSPHPVKDIDMERKEELILAKQLRASRVTILPRVSKCTLVLISIKHYFFEGCKRFLCSEKSTQASTTTNSKTTTKICGKGSKPNSFKVLGPMYGLVNTNRSEHSNSGCRKSIYATLWS